ncbi:MAG: carboxypeptidase-like regulatory domain-containing protein, partial [Bacteroidetes bacterium]
MSCINMSSLKILFSAALLFLASFAFGQKKIGEPVNGKGPFELTVIVEDGDNRKPLESASVLVEELGSGDITDENGRVRILLEPGNYTLMVSYLGFETLRQSIIFQGPGVLRARLASSAQTMEEVVVQANADRNVK